MRDRIPTKVLDNGAVRYAVYDENGALLRYEYMLPADEPADEGTALNKGTLLSDDTEQTIFGDVADRTVNDALIGLAEFTNGVYADMIYKAEKLYEYTIPSNVTSVSIPMSGIDWAKYDYVIMDTLVSGADTAYALFWRVNGDSTDSTGNCATFIQPGSGDTFYNRTSVVFTNGKPVRRRIVFKCYRDASRYICCSYDKEDLPGWGRHTTVKFSGFSNLIISSSQSGVKIAKGGTVKIYGLTGEALEW